MFKVAETKEYRMLWELVVRATESYHLAAFTAMMRLLTEMEHMLTPATVALAEMLLVASTSVAGMIFLQMFGKWWIPFLWKSDSDTKLVIPSWVRRSTYAPELSFMLLEEFNHPLKDWVVSSIVKAIINSKITEM